MDVKEKWCVAFASALIVVGVAGEYWFGGKATDAAERLQADATTKAEETKERAAKADLAAAELKKENLELERALEPRSIDQGDLAFSLNELPRVPIFISTVNLGMR